MFISLVGILWLFIASPSPAQGPVDTEMERHGIHRHAAIDPPYELRASVIRSGMLSRPVARKHDIEVAPDRGVLNVVVLKKQDGKQVTVTAEVTAITVNLLGQTQPIEMRKVNENEHVSYVGSFAFKPLTNLRFVVNASPPGSVEPLAIEFEEKLSPAE